MIYLLLGVGRILLIRNGKSGIGRVYLVRVLGGLVGSEGGAGWKRRKEVARFRAIWWLALSTHERASEGDGELVKQDRQRRAQGFDGRERDIGHTHKEPSEVI